MLNNGRRRNEGRPAVVDDVSCEGGTGARQLALNARRRRVVPALAAKWNSGDVGAEPGISRCGRDAEACKATESGVDVPPRRKPNSVSDDFSSVPIARDVARENYAV